MGDKQNDVVIVNTKNNKENMKIHICNHILGNLLYTYVYKYTNLIQVKKTFMTRLFLFNIQNKNFHDIVVNLVQ